MLSRNSKNPLDEGQTERLIALRERRPACDLTDAELLELYNLEKTLAGSNPYGQVIAVLSSFPPYLDSRPHLIPDFVDALYAAAHVAYNGLKTRADLTEFLNSKSQVDNDLGAAFTNHRAVFERAIAAEFER